MEALLLLLLQMSLSLWSMPKCPQRRCCEPPDVHGFPCKCTLPGVMAAKNAILGQTITETCRSASLFRQFL